MKYVWIKSCKNLFKKNVWLALFREQNYKSVFLLGNEMVLNVMVCDWRHQQMKEEAETCRT